MDIEIAGTYTRVSGNTHSDCVSLAGRYESKLGYRWPDIETWVVAQSGNRVYTLFCKSDGGWLTDIWRSETGAIHVSDMARAIWHRPPNPDLSVNGDLWCEHRAVGNMTGVWGLLDDYVMAWGLAEEARPCVMLWEGTGWREIAAPDFIVSSVHGARRDLMFAAGDDGRVARWDGSAWTELDTPTDHQLVSVFCAGEDEVYACGGSTLLRADANGWSELLTANRALTTVAKWQGDVWVGAHLPLGLCRLEDGQLVSKKPNLDLRDIDVRTNLLFATPSNIISTEAGERYFGNSVKHVLDLIDDIPPTWR